MSRFNPSSLERRDLVLIIGSGLIVLVVIAGLVVVLVKTSGNQAGSAAGLTLTAGATPSLTPTLSPTTPSGPPTATATPAPTPTLEPYQYVVKPGETLYAIIQYFGYTDVSVVPEILRLNNLPNPDALQAGQTLLIPRQTPTPGPSPLPSPTPVQGVTGTPGATQDYGGCSPEHRCVSPDGKYWVHEVQSGDSVSWLAYAYTSQRDAILQANGLTENSFLSIGQIIYIPILVTLTPTLTPTGGPDSTATPTPTLSAPWLLAPANGATIQSGDAVILQWVAVHPLAGNQYYLVIVRNVASGQEQRATTRSNSYRLPGSLKPGLGQSAQFEWQVVIVNGSDTTLAPISGQGTVWTFTWGP